MPSAPQATPDQSLEGQDAARSSGGVDAAPAQKTRAVGPDTQNREWLLNLFQVLLATGLGLGIAWMRLFMKFGFGHRLYRNPFAWAYVALAGGLSSLTYMAGFDWLKEETESVGLFLAATTGAGPIIGNIVLILVGRLLSASKAAEMESASLGESLEKSKDILLELIRNSIEERRQKRITELAERHRDLELIKRTAQDLADASVAAGSLTLKDRDEALAGVLELQGGDSERSDFDNRRLAIQRATQVIAIDHLESHLARAKWDGRERRSEQRRRVKRRWEGEERRSGVDRRVGVGA